MNEDEKIVLNGEQEAALGVMMSGANVFLTGEAGTGKSTLVREFLRRCERECVPLVRSVVSGAGGKGRRTRNYTAADLEVRQPAASYLKEKTTMKKGTHTRMGF